MNNPGHINGGPVIGGLGVNPQDQANHQGGESGQNEERVAGSAVLCEVTNSFPQRHQDVQIGQQTADTAPQQGAPADIAAQHGLADSSSQPDLRHGAHVAFPYPTTVMRPNIMVSPTL